MTARYVATDPDGTQHHEGAHRRWPLPVAGDGGYTPGASVAADGDGPVVTHDADELLDKLDAQVFVAELAPDGSARLLGPTAWSEPAAARFALDCVVHLLPQIPGTSEAELPSGGTLPEVVAEAVAYLAGESATAEHLGEAAKLAAAHRLRREADEIADEAVLEVAADDAGDVELFDDPIWVTLAATRDAVLAAVEAVRHHALTEAAGRESERYERHEEGKPVAVRTFEMPWGTEAIGGAPRHEPGWAAARDAAERARQAVADESGEAAAAAERSWQAEHLAELLGPG